MRRGRVPRVCVLVCAFASGCDALWNLDHLDSSDARTLDGVETVADVALGRCANPILHDTFDGPEPCMSWASSYADLGATIKATGQLEITPAAQINSIAGCVSNNNYAFGTGISAVVTSVVTGPSTYTVLQIHGPELQIKMAGSGTLRFQTSASQDIGAPIAYNPAMKWWRIRPTGTSSITGEYSVDGETYLPLGTAAVAMPATVGIELSAGTNSTTVIGKAAFDELQICPD
jgi:hypothetical protein